MLTRFLPLSFEFSLHKFGSVLAWTKWSSRYHGWEAHFESKWFSAGVQDPYIQWIGHGFDIRLAVFCHVCGGFHCNLSDMGSGHWVGEPLLLFCSFTLDHGQRAWLFGLQSIYLHIYVCFAVLLISTTPISIRCKQNQLGLVVVPQAIHLYSKPCPAWDEKREQCCSIHGNWEHFRTSLYRKRWQRGRMRSIYEWGERRKLCVVMRPSWCQCFPISSNGPDLGHGNWARMM